MADHSSLAAGEQRCELMCSGQQRAGARQIDTPVEPSHRSLGATSAEEAMPHAGEVRLRSREQPQLLRRDRVERLLAAAVGL
jgi:hypothetical protein